jgi:hypothetical protein
MFISLAACGSLSVTQEFYSMTILFLKFEPTSNQTGQLEMKPRQIKLEQEFFFLKQRASAQL